MKEIVIGGTKIKEKENLAMLWINTVYENVSLTNYRRPTEFPLPEEVKVSAGVLRIIRTDLYVKVIVSVLNC